MLFTPFSSIILLLKASVEDQHHRDDGAYGSSGRRKSRYRKHHGQQKATSFNGLHNYQPTPTQQIITKNNQQTRNGNEEARVHKWLWQSTSKLLGDDLTFQIINDDSGDGDVDGNYSPQQVGHYFDTQADEDEIQHPQIELGVNG